MVDREKSECKGSRKLDQFELTKRAKYNTYYPACDLNSFIRESARNVLGKKKIRFAAPLSEKRKKRIDAVRAYGEVDKGGKTENHAH